MEKALKEESKNYVLYLEHWGEQRLFYFHVEQSERKFTEEAFLTLADINALKDLEMKHTIELHAMQLNHLAQMYNTRVDIAVENQILVYQAFCFVGSRIVDLLQANEQFSGLHPLILAHMNKEHELELIHQAKQQQVEREQQQELLRYDQRTEYREFVKQRQLDEKQLLRTFKVFKQQKRKEMNSKQIKEKTDKMRADWQAEQDKKESDFLKLQREAKEEEEMLLKNHHEIQVQRTKEVFGPGTSY